MEEKNCGNCNLCGVAKNSILESLPGKNCGLCGFKTCEQFAEIVAKNPVLSRCIHLEKKDLQQEKPKDHIDTWKDHLGRDYDFILDKFEGRAGATRNYNTV